MPVIRATDLSFSYEKEFPVLEDISLEIDEGNFIGLVGPNGSGKTTLTRIILGLEKPDSGSVEVLGGQPDKVKERVGYVPQNYERDKHFPATVRELLDLVDYDEDRYECSQIVDTLDIQNLMASQFVNLSGGQQQRVVAAMALLKDPEILILDEPSVGVDVKTQEDFYDFLHHLNKEHNITIILISHDIGMVSEHADEVVLLNNSICCKGDVDELPDLMEMAYGDQFKVFDHLGEHNHD